MTITPARDLLTRYNARFAAADYSLVSQWITDGADMERDILPVLAAWTRRKKDIYSLGFFTRYVQAAVKAREQAERAPLAGPEAEERRARGIAFTTRKLGQRHPAEERWLAAYEAKNGRIELQQQSKEAV